MKLYCHKSKYSFSLPNNLFNIPRRLISQFVGFFSFQVWASGPNVEISCKSTPIGWNFKLNKILQTKIFYFPKLFLFLRYSIFCISIFPSFFSHVSHCFRGWSKKNLKVYGVINCLIKNFITHFVWYLEKEIKCDIETLSIDRELNKDLFYGKIMQKMCTKS